LILVGIYGAILIKKYGTKKLPKAKIQLSYFWEAIFEV
jgi:hypothetical protein